MTNQQIIETFYTAFQQKDYKTMQNLYADDAVFNDEAFTNLNANQVRAMWQMLITRGKDLQLTFKNIKADATTGSANWIASYTFSATGHKVTNDIKANFVFANGKIKQHTDSFDFYKWSSQALLWKGKLFGRFPFFKKKVQQVAMANLEKFMEK
jgi:ketosteroid isomerase-like protein